MLLGWLGAFKLSSQTEFKTSLASYKLQTNQEKNNLHDGWRKNGGFLDSISRDFC
jgi:hypothetical protein